MISCTYYATDSTTDTTTWGGVDPCSTTWYTTTTINNEYPAEDKIRPERILPRPLRNIALTRVNTKPFKFESFAFQYLPQESCRLRLRNTERIKPFPKLKQILRKMQ